MIVAVELVGPLSGGDIVLCHDCVAIGRIEPPGLAPGHYDVDAAAADGRSDVENQRSRIVPWEGNIPALQSSSDVFELRQPVESLHRGFIAQRALEVPPAYAEFDSELRFNVRGVRVAGPKSYQCGEVLTG